MSLIPMASLAVVAIAVPLPFTPMGTHFGFAPPPAGVQFIPGAMAFARLFLVERARQGFCRWSEAARLAEKSVVPVQSL